MQHLAKSNATPDNINTVQAAVYRFEALDGAIELDAPKGEKAHIWLSRADVRELMSLPDDSLIGQRDKLALALLVGAGLRREEAATLKFNQVKLLGSRCTIEVMGKGKKSRVVPVSVDLCKIIAAWKETINGDDDSHILRSISKGGTVGESLSGTSLYRTVQAYGEKIGQAELQPHDLRRTYAQIGLDSGVAIQQISKLLGHSSIAITQRYLQIDLDLKTTISDCVPLG